MEKTLNDRIEGIFRSTVLIVLSFISSIFVLLLWPVTGYILLIRRQRSKSEDTIRPYAFLFFAITLVFFLPSLVDALSPHLSGAFEYQVHDSSTYEGGALSRAYQKTTQQIESKAATAMLVAALIGIAVLHLGAVFSGKLLFRLRPRAEIWHDALFLVGGLQITLFTLALLLDRFSWTSLSEMQVLAGLVRSPATLIWGYRDFRPYPIIDVLNVGLLVFILLLPVSVARRFVSRISPIARRPISSRAMAVGTVLLAGVINVLTLGSFAVAAYVSDEAQPHEKPVYPFAILYPDCSLASEATRTQLTGTAVLKIAATDAWFFDVGDFKVFIAADRVEADAPVPIRRRARSAKRIGFEGGALQVTLSAVSPKLGSPPFLVQAGQSVLVQFEADAPPEISTFLSAHPDQQRCTLFYTNDYPIGGIGSLRQK